MRGLLSFLLEFCLFVFEGSSGLEECVGCEADVMQRLLGENLREFPLLGYSFLLEQEVNGEIGSTA